MHASITKKCRVFDVAGWDLRHVLMCMAYMADGCEGVLGLRGKSGMRACTEVGGPAGYRISLRIWLLAFGGSHAVTDMLTGFHRFYHVLIGASPMHYMRLRRL